MSGHDSKYFSTTKKGEIPELKEELNSQYKVRPPSFSFPSFYISITLFNKCFFMISISDMRQLGFPFRSALLDLFIFDLDLSFGLFDFVEFSVATTISLEDRLIYIFCSFCGEIEGN
jgi:hypothetical protein